MTKRAQPGYYPQYRTLDQKKFWDAKTREVVTSRVENVPPVRFFSAQQLKLMEAVCRHILPQDDRDDAHFIPIVPQIDKRLFEDTHDGYRFEDMPPDRDAYRVGLEAIDEIAKARHGAGFTELSYEDGERILQSLHDGDPGPAQEIWKGMPVERFWMLLLQDCAEAYYSHPWAWDEIGFGGPAYPRAYMRLERGEAEPWESDEKPYEWDEPPGTLSNRFTPLGGKGEHRGGPQGGTH